MRVLALLRELGGDDGVRRVLALPVDGLAGPHGLPDHHPPSARELPLEHAARPVPERDVEGDGCPDPEVERDLPEHPHHQVLLLGAKVRARHPGHPGARVGLLTQQVHRLGPGLLRVDGHPDGCVLGGLLLLHGGSRPAIDDPRGFHRLVALQPLACTLGPVRGHALERGAVQGVA